MARTNDKTGSRKRNSARAGNDTLVEHIAKRISEDIETGVLASGTHLQESVLAGRYGVSRTPLREALRLLEGQGLLDNRGGRGTYVHEFSTQEFLEVREIRIALETALIHLAVPRLSNEALDEAVRLATDIEGTPMAEMRYLINPLIDFYDVIYKPARRPFMLSLLSRMLLAEQPYLTALHRYTHAYHVVFPNLLQFVELLRKRDSDEAARFQTERLWSIYYFYVRHAL